MVPQQRPLPLLMAVVVAQEVCTIELRVVHELERGVKSAEVCLLHLAVVLLKSE